VPDDDLAHHHAHQKYLNGPGLQGLLSLSPIGHVGALRVLMIDATTPAPVRRELAEVVYVAQVETPDFPAGYDGTVTEADERLFLVAGGARAVAFAVTALDEPHWRLRWEGHDALEFADQQAIPGDRQKIGRVWVAKAHRRQGIAKGLLEIVARTLGCELRDLGWELPLTGDGRRLLRKLLPETWLGRGDAFALEETLKAPASEQEAGP